MGKKSCIVVDSSSNVLNNDYNNVFMVPLHITKILNNQETLYKDLLDINTSNLIKELHDNPNVVFKSSQTSLGEMLDTLDKLTKEYEIIYIWPISKGLSGSINTWQIAKNDYPNCDINIIDSGHISVGIKDKVIQMSKMIDDNRTKEEILEFANSGHDKWYGMLNVNDLTQLKNGGRINSVKAFIANALKLNILISYDGKLDFVSTEKNFDKSIDKMLDFIDSKISFRKNGIKKAYMYTTYIDTQKNDEIKEKISSKINFKIDDIHFFPAVIALHTGCATFGIYIETN